MKSLKILNAVMLLSNLNSIPNIPIIELSNFYIYVGYSQNMTEEEFTKLYISCTDVETPSDKIIVYYEPELQLSWPKNTSHFVYAVDEDNNTSSNYFLLYVIDDLSPVIYGPETLSYDYQNIPTIEEILSFYSAVDEVDGHCNITSNDIIDSYTKSITLLASDTSGNRTTKKISINFTSEPTYWYIESTLTISNKSYMPAYSIINKLIENNQLQNIDYLYASYVDKTYDNNFMITGLYDVEIEIFTLEKEQPFKIKVHLNVVNENEEILEEENISTPWWESLFNFIKKLFQKIIEFFS